MLSAAVASYSASPMLHLHSGGEGCGGFACRVCFLLLPGYRQKFLICHGCSPVIEPAERLWMAKGASRGCTERARKVGAKDGVGRV